MGLAILVIVAFKFLEEFNRPHLPPPSDTKRKNEDTEGGNSNEEASPSLRKFKIHISWEILHRSFGESLIY